MRNSALLVKNDYTNPVYFGDLTNLNSNDVMIFSGIVNDKLNTVSGVILAKSDSRSGHFIMRKEPSLPENEFTFTIKFSDDEYKTYRVIDADNILNLNSGDSLEITRVTNFFKNSGVSDSIASKFESKLKVTLNGKQHILDLGESVITRSGKVYLNTKISTQPPRTQTELLTRKTIETGGFCMCANGTSYPTVANHLGEPIRCLNGTGYVLKSNSSNNA